MLLAVVFMALLLLADANDRRIINGKYVRIDEFPYQVSIEEFGNHMCGGTIIAPQLVLTAGHCFAASRTSSIFTVRVGSSITMRGGKVHNVISVKTHPLFTMSPIMNDVALILLDTPIRFNRRAQPIKLSDRTPYIGEVLTVTGYGDTNIHRQKAQRRHLAAVNVPVVSNEVCINKLGPLGGSFRHGMVCAGDRKGHKDACQGDSGGPAVNKNHLVGITSWGIGCGVEGRPGVYTDVANFRPFIEQAAQELLSLRSVSKPGPL